MKEPKQFQFRLSTLLVVIAVCGVLLAARDLPETIWREIFWRGLSSDTSRRVGRMVVVAIAVASGITAIIAFAYSARRR
jgi:hypothetical protein